MTTKLYKHQRDAVAKMKNGCILCGGVGTGKSRTAIAYFIQKVCGGYSTVDGNQTVKNPKPLYIITTAKKRDSLDWEKEACGFMLTKTDVTVAPMFVDSWNNIAKYTDVSGAFFIFDEQRLVGKGQWTKSFLDIAKKNQWVVLSATPGDTWSDYIAIFLANGFFRNRTEFNAEHVVYSRFTKFPKIVRYINTRKLERLLDSILVRMDYEKEAVRHYEWVKVAYDEELYDIINKERWDFYAGEPIENPSKWCYLCRRVVNEDEHRFEAVKNVLFKNPRVIIFYNFDYELESLRENLERIEYPYFEYNGHKHDPLPRSNEWVYLVQYTAGAEGWNCTSTNVIIFYSMNYSYKVFEQASGRIDRLNTKYRDLYYYTLFSDAPIDKAIRAALTKKKTFNERNWIEKNMS